MGWRRALAIVAVVCTLSTPAMAQIGMASWYGGGAHERLSHTTASGAVFRPKTENTCAHRKLPFGTLLRIILGAHSVVCRVTDRGPAAYTHRVVDLSKHAAEVIGLTALGVAKVSIEIVSR